MTDSKSSSQVINSDPENPYWINVALMPKEMGSNVPFKYDLSNPDPIGLEMIKIPAEKGILFDGLFQSVGDGILVTLNLKSQAFGECSRCLKEIEFNIDNDLVELFHYQNQENHQSKHKPKTKQEIEITDDESDDFFYIKDDVIDLEQSVIDTLALELPLSPLCTPNCAGLCTTCGEDLNLNPHQHEVHNDKFQDLASWKLKLENKKIE